MTAGPDTLKNEMYVFRKVDPRKDLTVCLKKERLK